MSGFPSYDTLAVGLLALLVGWALGDSWGRRQERDTLERRWDHETQRVRKNTRAWHQQPQGQRQLRVGPEPPGEPPGAEATPDARSTQHWREWDG